MEALEDLRVEKMFAFERGNEQVIRCRLTPHQPLPSAELPGREHLGEGRVDWHLARTLSLDRLLELPLPVVRGGDEQSTQQIQRGVVGSPAQRRGLSDSHSSQEQQGI